MLIVVVNRVRSGRDLLSKSDIRAGIQISIETRKVATADFKPNYVPFAKHIACGP